MTDETHTSFDSKIDLWLMVVILLAVASPLAAVLLSTATREEWLVGAGCTLLTAGIVAACGLPTRYTITEDELVIRFGVFTRRIRLGDILRVYPTWNPLSAPALSLDRLGIDYRSSGRRGFTLVSPRQRAEFLSLIEARTGLSPEGGGLILHEETARARANARSA